MRFGNEARVGFVVVLALAMALTGYFFLRGIGLGADLYTIRLNGAGAIAKGNDVLLQGIKVGTVREVALDPATQKPLVTVAIQKADPPFKLLKNYRYAVQPSGIIGENYVDIRGVYNASAPLYAANDPSQQIPGIASPGIAGLTDSASAISAQLTKTLEKVNVTIDRVNKGVLSYDNQVRLAKTLDSVVKLTRNASQTFGPQGVKVGFGDPQTQRLLNQTLSNTVAASAQGVVAARNISNLTGQAGSQLNSLSGQASSILSQTDGLFKQAGGIVSENRVELRGLLRDFRSTAQNLAGLTESVNFLVKNSGLKENAQLTLNSLRRTSENVEATTAGLRRLSEDPELANTLKTTLASIRASTESLSKIASSVEGLVGDETTQSQLKATLSTFSQTATTLQATTQNILAISESFKGVVTDPELQRTIKAIPNELLGTLQATRATAERVNSLLGGRRTRSTDASSNSTTAAPANIASQNSGLSVTLRRLGQSDNRGDRTFGDVDFQGELFGSPLRAGLSNIGENTGLTLQTGTFLGRKGAVRYGLFRSKLGVGLDYQMGKLRFEGNLYDPNRRSYAVYGGYRIAPGVEVLVGGEKGRGVRTGSVGVRLSR
jgi:phospholipid/cholesterol/gamma-HCH transport system substrate-binding protein